MTKTACASDRLEQFNRDGFIIARQLFSGEEVDGIRKTFTDMASHGPIEGLSADGHRLTPGEPLAKWPRMLHPHRHLDKPVGPLALKYMLDPRIRTILDELFGEEPIAAQSMFYFKPPGARGQDFHQDNFYLRVKPGTCMAAWVAIDDADMDNGGLVVAPGSHTLDIVCPEKSNRELFFTTEHVEIPAGLKEHPVTMKAGDVLFFNGSLIHGSYPNRTRDRFRRALICHYVPTSCVEVSDFYRPLLRFDGTEVVKQVAQGGGPCGEAQAMITAPH